LQQPPILLTQDLLNQTGHYNEKSRKHALVGLGDLFTRHPGELAAHVGAVYSRVVERMADSDEDVRKAAQQLLRSQMVPLIPSASMRPFMPMIMAHVCR
jgi:pre-rRNA-processing protein IPI1